MDNRTKKTNNNNKSIYEAQLVRPWEVREKTKTLFGGPSPHYRLFQNNWVVVHGYKISTYFFILCCHPTRHPFTQTLFVISLVSRISWAFCTTIPKAQFGQRQQELNQNWVRVWLESGDYANTWHWILPPFPFLHTHPSSWPPYTHCIFFSLWPSPMWSFLSIRDRQFGRMGLFLPSLFPSLPFIMSRIIIPFSLVFFLSI